MSKNRSFIDGHVARVVINIILTVVTAISASLVTRFNSVKLTILCIVICVISIILQGLYSLRLSTIDKIKEQAISDSKKRMKAFELLFNSLSKELQNASSGINSIASSVIKKGRAPENRWTFDDSSNKMCAIIYELLIILSAKGSDIHVNYVKRNDSDVNYISLVGCCNYMDEPPINYREDRNINDSDAYFDARLFRTNRSHAIIKLTPHEVDTVFEYKDREKESGKREQIVFIPVLCNQKKMVGLVEIIADKGTVIAETEEEMKKIIKMIRVIHNAMLLLQKSEKAALAIPKIPSLKK